MSRIWLLRGVAAAVLVVMAGAWLTGVAVLGGDTTATDKASVPVAPETSATPEEQSSPAVENVGDRRTPRKSPSPRATDATESAAPSTPASQDPVGQAPAPTRTAPASPKPANSGKPGKPSKSGAPSSTPPPSSPSSPPSPACTDLVTVVGCVLAPITSRP